MRLGKFLCQAESDYAATSSNIDDFRFSIFDFRFNQFNQLFRLRARNERASVTKKSQSAKFHSAEQMLERLALGPTSNQFAQRSEFVFVERAFKFQIQFDPLSPDYVSQQELGVQPWIVDAALFEIRSCRLKHLEHGRGPFFCHVERSRDISNYFAFYDSPCMPKVRDSSASL